MQLLEITGFLTKYVDLMYYDKPHNSIPFLLLIVMYIYVQINMVMAIIIELENFEKVLLSMTDTAMMVLILTSIIYRNFNIRQAKKLIELIGGDFAINADELMNRSELREKIGNYCNKKRQNMRVMFRNLGAIYVIIAVFTVNKNYSNNFSSTENASTNWPTPFLCYTPIELQSTILFIYTYSLHALLLFLFLMDGFFIISSVSLATERVLADFGIIYILLKDIEENFTPAKLRNNDDHLSYFCEQKMDNLKKDMKRIIYCHQKLNRNFKVCAESTGLMISVINLTVMLSCCSTAYLTLMLDDLKKKVVSASTFITIVAALFSCYHNGQLIFNQNEIFRQSLAALPWVDKPHWFKQSLHMIMTRANIDIEMKPYGIYVMNYVSFKDLMKTIFSVGNVLYVHNLKLTSQTQ